jgi:hypothetical protein
MNRLDLLHELSELDARSEHTGSLCEMPSSTCYGTPLPLGGGETSGIGGFQMVDLAPLKVRTFDTGATRDTDQNKHDPEGFTSPLVDQRFNEFMHKNRFQKDGNYRDGDNWQKGIPKDQYMKSMLRHVQDARLHHDGFNDLTVEDFETALCAIIFNAKGYLFELLQEKRKTQNLPTPRP